MDLEVNIISNFYILTYKHMLFTWYTYYEF